MIFVDTSAWYALTVANSSDHLAAREVFRDLRLGGRGRLVTTDYVVAETYTLLKLKHGPGPARGLAKVLAHSGAVEQVWVGEEGFRDALELLLHREDKRWSFTDCTSFVVMKELDIPVAFTLDEDFRQAGFQVLPGA